MEGSSGDHLETELKFDVGPDFVLPDLGGLPGGLTVTGPAASLLIASYYDTSDLRLAGARVTLRRRTGGSDEGWHLKLPVAGNTRRELHEPLGSDSDGVPPRFQAAVFEWAGRERLGVVAVLETRRTVRNLVAPGGEVAAELADDLVTGTVRGPADAPAESLTWREIEIELVSGRPEILAVAGARLTAAGATPSGSSSKLGRLLGARAADGSV
jgi:inorganic triphosphatase YgiF